MGITALLVKVQINKLYVALKWEASHQLDPSYMTVCWRQSALLCSYLQSLCLVHIVTDCHTLLSIFLYSPLVCMCKTLGSCPYRPTFRVLHSACLGRTVLLGEYCVLSHCSASPIWVWSCCACVYVYIYVSGPVARPFAVLDSVDACSDGFGAHGGDRGVASMCAPLLLHLPSTLCD